MKERIHLALQDFETESSAAVKALRSLREENEYEFGVAALAALFEPDAIPGFRELIQMVQESGDLLPKLLDPAVEIGMAARGMEALCSVDGTADIRLIRMIALDSSPATHEKNRRILDILDRITTVPRLVPLLMQVYRTAPQNIRARLTTMIGRTHRNQEWVEQRLKDPDARVRANIVEIYIGENTPEALEIFRRGISDNAPRVIANAALGLYFAGSSQTIKFLGVQLGRSSNAPERASAAWAMGRTLDPRFRHPLSELVRDSDPIVRRQAIGSLALLRREGVQNGPLPVPSAKGNGTDDPPSSDAVDLSVDVTIKGAVQHRGQDGNTHVRLEARRPSLDRDGDPIIVPARGLRPIELVTFENETPILDYELRDREQHGAVGSYDLFFHSRHKGHDPELTFQFRKHTGIYRAL